MLIACLMIFSLTINSCATVTVNEDNEGNVTFIYQLEDHKNVEAALIELKEYRESYIKLEEENEIILKSRDYWKDLHDDKEIDLKLKTLQRNIAIGSTITTTVVALILAVIK